MSRTTLAAPARWEVDIKKSRFLAQAAPIDSPEDALTFLSEVSDANATHNCWAWRVEQNYRFFDDGEPASTAGKPILAAIDGQGLDAVMVVVTRWFGGIKLGAGGLVRAYGGTAAECLRQAEHRVIITQVRAQVRCGFEHLGSLHAALETHEASKTAEHYEADGIHLELQLPEARYESLATTIRDATRGQARLVLIDDPPAAS